MPWWLSRTDHGHCGNGVFKQIEFRLLWTSHSLPGANAYRTRASWVSGLLVGPPIGAGIRHAGPSPMAWLHGRMSGAELPKARHSDCRQSVSVRVIKRVEGSFAEAPFTPWAVLMGRLGESWCIGRCRKVCIGLARAS